jgi:hypothetical protein
LITLFANKNKKLSALIAIAAIAVSWVISWVVFFQAWFDHHFYEHPIELPLFSIPTGASAIELGFRVDSLTAVMLFMVPFVCLMIFIYSWGYMGIGKKVAGGFDTARRLLNRRAMDTVGTMTTANTAAARAGRPAQRTSIRWPAASSPTSPFCLRHVGAGAGRQPGAALRLLGDHGPLLLPAD